MGFKIPEKHNNKKTDILWKGKGMLNLYWYLNIEAPCVSLALGWKLGGLLKMKSLLLK